jgi:small subunit ribosomal protein S5
VKGNGGALVMLRPAGPGTGVIAGGSCRTVLELAGYKNVFAKQIGCNNPLNNARAVVKGLSEMRTYKQVAKAGLYTRPLISLT